MKNRAKCTMAAFLAALMLVLAVPMTGLVGLASDAGESTEPVLGKVVDNPALSKGSLQIQYGDDLVRGTETQVTTEDGYYSITGSAPSLPAQGKFTGVLHGFSGFNYNSIKGKDADGNFLVSRDSFVLEMSLGQTDYPLSFAARMRFSLTETDGKAYFLGKDADGNEKWVTQTGLEKKNDFNRTILEVVQDTGVVKAFGKTIGNVKEADQHISLSFTWSEEKAGYLVDAYVNGKLMANDILWNSLNNDKSSLPYTLSAEVDGVTYTREITSQSALKDFHDGTALQRFAEYNLYANNKTYKSDANAFTAVTNEAGETTGYSFNYDLPMKNVYITFGTHLPNIEVNRLTITNGLILATNGKKLEGYTTNGAYSTKVIPDSEIVDGYITLPEIEGGWLDPITGEPITRVPASVLGSGACAAYTEAAYALFAKISDFAVTNANKTVKNEDGSITFNTYLKSDPLPEGATQYADQNLQITNIYEYLSNGFGDTANAVLKLSFTADSAVSPAIAVRFRNGLTWQNSLVSLSGKKIALGVDTSADYTEIPVTPGKQYDITLYITIVNIRDAEGNVTGSSTYVTAYINGVLYDTVRLGARSGASINTGTNNDMNWLQLQLNGGTSNATEAPASYTINDLAFYTGTTSYAAPAILSGASIRVGETADDSGLRFSFAADKEWFDSLEGAVAGAIIVPTDKIGELSELTVAALDAAGIRYANETVDKFANESTADTYIYHLSLVKILDKNYARSFTAIGYVKVGDTYYYTGTVSRSVAEVARSYAASGEMTEAHAETVLGFAAKVVYLSESYEVVAPAGYTSPYAAAYADGKLVISVATVTTGEGDEAVTAPAVAGADVSDILAIVVGDTVYTKGFAAADGSISITLETATEPAPIEPAPEA